MADTPEAKVKKQVRKLLDDLPAYYFFPATHGYGRSGVPDIIFCYKGVFGAIECKAGKGQLTALQEREIKWIEDHAGFTFVAGRALVLFVGDDSPAACAMTLNCDDMEAYNLIQDVHNYFHFLNIKDAPAKERFN